MIKIKKNIIVIVLTIILYFIITLIYNCILYLNENNTIYILNRNINRGDTITNDMICCARLLKRTDISNNKYLIKDEIINMVAKDNYLKGQTLSLDMLVAKENFLEYTKDKEIISIEFVGDDVLKLNEINNNSIIDIYYTCSRSEISNLESYNINSNNYSDKKYITTKLMENTKIIKVLENNQINTEDVLKKSVLIEVDSALAIKIQNIKNYGTFSFSVKIK